MRPVHAFTITGKQGWETVDTFVYRSGKLVCWNWSRCGKTVPRMRSPLSKPCWCTSNRLAPPKHSVRDFPEEVRRVSGFDRVMVYRFLPDGSGIVDAESRADGVESFLGLRYPASDIPRQARELYLNNWIRLIPNARYTPEPIIPADDPRTGTPLDLSHSLIRSVSPMHLEYLANMSVAASCRCPLSWMAGYGG